MEGSHRVARGFGCPQPLHHLLFQASSLSASQITPLAPPAWPGRHKVVATPLGVVSVSLWEREAGPSRCAGHTGTSLGQCQCSWAPWAHGCCPQVELLALVDLQGSASVSVDNVAFEQCYLDVVSPTAAGTARGTWAGRVTPHSFHGGCLVAVTLSKSRIVVLDTEGQGPA